MRTIDFAGVVLVASSLACAISCRGGGSGDAQPPPKDAAPSTLVIDFPASDAGDVVAHAELDPSTFAVTVRAPWKTEPLVSSAKGRSLVAVKLDPDDLAAWHDPETASEADFVDIGPLRRAGDAPNGGVALRAAIPSGGSIDVTIAPVSSGDPGALAIDVVASGAPVALIELRLALDDDASAYLGFGERFDHVDARGSLVPLSFRLGSHTSGTNEAHVPIPTFTSSRGYGFTIATGEAGAADVGHGDPQLLRLVFEGGALHARLIARRSPLAVVTALTKTTGLPRLPPRWAYAPMQWRNEGVGTKEVLDDVTTTRAKKIPGGCFWIDNPWQASYDDSAFNARFPDPKAMIDAVRALGFEVVVWSTPYLEIDRGTPANQAQKWFDEASAKRFLITSTSGKIFDAPDDVAKPTPVAMLDLVSPDARAWWSDKLKVATSLGVVGYKLDFAEVLVPEFLGRRLDVVVGGKPLRETRAQYPLMYHRAYRDSVPAGGPGAFIVGRASSLSGQREVDAIWPGDLDSDFRKASDKEVGGLPASVVAIQSLAASGFPTFAADTGGFRGGRAVKEVFLRWAEHNAYSIILQSGGGGESHAPWTYDDETVTLYRALSRRHMDLVPYLRALSIAAANDGTPTVRAIPLVFPDETKALGAHVDDEYLLGDALLIAPVLVAGAASREVYVPSGAWVRWSSGERVVGPLTTTLLSKLGDPIALVREGAVVPLLASDVDTLGTASDPSVVTAAMRASVFRAYAVPSATRARATFEDGTTVDVDDAPTIVFAPTPSDGTLTISLEGASAAAWTLDGAPLSSSSDEGSVEGCAAPGCVFVDGARKRVVVHLAHRGTARGR